MNINCIGPIYYRFRKGEIFFELWFGVHFFELTSVDFFIEEREKQFCRALWSGVQPFCVDFWFSLFSILYSFVPIFIFVCCCFSSFFFLFFFLSFFYFLFPIFLFPIFLFFFFPFFSILYCSFSFSFPYFLFFLFTVYYSLFFLAICESFRTFLGILPPPIPHPPKNLWPP